ncbi:MAG: molybdopterin-dependent oxidoreductase [Candidatus Synoicihabitans palmerolidicus]|nr:molybdopterin-dependent oxidoreductase [Candidatus Synoicihabitans palmerolidicus]
MTSRGVTNEIYYLAQKAARYLGTNHVDNAARLCHSPSTAAMKQTLGISASTCSYSDWFGTDVIVFFGSNPANDQPVSTKYLHLAKKRGTKVILVNPYLEPGMQRYWVPSNIDSALFGSDLADDWYAVSQGGDIAFLYGVLKHLDAAGLIDSTFLAEHTSGWEALVSRARDIPRHRVVHLGTGRRPACRPQDQFRRAYRSGQNRRLRLVHGHHSTPLGCRRCAYDSQHRPRPELARSRSLRRHAHPGPLLRSRRRRNGSLRHRLSRRSRRQLHQCRSAGEPLWLRHPRLVRSCRHRNGRSRPSRQTRRLPYGRRQLPAHPARSRLRRRSPATHALAYPSGYHRHRPNAPRSLRRGHPPPRPNALRTRRWRHRNQYRAPRHVPPPQIPRQVGEARAEWKILRDIALSARPDPAGIFGCATEQTLWEEIARVVPFYDGIQNFRTTGDAFQYGGPHLCPDGVCPTDDGRAHLATIDLPPVGQRPAHVFHVSTRRGKQFNTLIYAEIDPLNNAPCDAVLMNVDDAATRHLKQGDQVTLHNSLGRYTARVHLAPIAPGNLQIHWPEGNHLIDRTRKDAGGGVPDYNALVKLETV